MQTISDKQAPLLASAPKVLEATYTKPYMAHASIGPSAAVAEFKDDKYTVWTHSQGVFPLRGELVKALKVPPASIRCIHAEGSGCYGHNGADDVALDAALLARAVPGKPVRLQWMRDDEFAWEPFGPAMAMQAKASLDAEGRIVDWNYDVWSNSHSTRPLSTTGANVLAAWYLAEPQKMGPPTSPPQPAGGGDRNAIPLYEFPEPEGRASLRAGHADPGVGFADTGRLRQRVRSRILHGRTGARRRRRSGRVSSGAHEGPACARRDREGRRDGRLEGRRDRRLRARPRHRLLEIQEPRLLLRGRSPTSRSTAPAGGCA